MEILQSLRSVRLTLTKDSLRMTEAKESLRMTIGGELGDLDFDIVWNLGFGTTCSRDFLRSLTPHSTNPLRG